MNSEGVWSTYDELNYIDNLGNIKFRQLKWITKKELLQDYLRGAKKRKDWGTMDAGRVIGYAQSMLGMMK